MSEVLAARVDHVHFVHDFVERCRADGFDPLIRLAAGGFEFERDFHFAAGRHLQAPGVKRIDVRINGRTEREEAREFVFGHEGSDFDRGTDGLFDGFLLERRGEAEAHPAIPDQAHREAYVFGARDRVNFLIPGFDLGGPAALEIQLKLTCAQAL